MRSSLGILGNMAVGIVGAFAGGYIAALFSGLGSNGINLWSAIAAILGAIALLLAARLVTGGARRAV